MSEGMLKPELKEITVGIKRLVNLGNFENVTYECTVVTQCNVLETPDAAYERALDFCKEKVGAEIDRLMESLPKRK